MLYYGLDILIDFAGPKASSKVAKVLYRPISRLICLVSILIIAPSALSLVYALSDLLLLRIIS
jgi:hypothetical protein